MIPPITLHATAVAYKAKTVLIIGRAGKGKSSLALQLMAYGAQLISDDGVTITEQDGQPVASVPKAISGLIEARGVGLLIAEAHAPAPIHLIVDMDLIETERLPLARTRKLLTYDIPLLHKSEMSHFPAAILQYLKGGRQEIP